jgi:hypothetical protein
MFRGVPIIVCQLDFTNILHKLDFHLPKQLNDSTLCGFADRPIRVFETGDQIWHETPELKTMVSVHLQQREGQKYVH